MLLLNRLSKTRVCSNDVLTMHDPKLHHTGRRWRNDKWSPSITFQLPFNQSHSIMTIDRSAFDDVTNYINTYRFLDFEFIQP